MKIPQKDSLIKYNHYYFIINIYMVKKKTKSVERVKKKKVEEKPIIENIQVKQPLSKGSQNLNNQIVQVIFPADMEIRKVKKKKRKRTPKKDNEKEELLNELKEKLQQYDSLQEQAQQANIKIPSELGVSVISKSDLKTNEDIKTYINDIVKKIGLLQELIEKTKTPAPSTGLPLRMGSGLIGLQPPIQPQIQPQIQPFQPQIPIQPVRPQVQPAPVQPVDDKQARLQRLIKAAQDRIAGQGGTVPVAPPLSPTGINIGLNPLSPRPQIPPLGLQKFSIPKDGITLEVQAPSGWGELYNLYTMYSRATEQQTANNQFVKGVFHIPLQEYNSLIDSRNQFVTKYNTYLSNLTPAERAYLEDSNNINIHRLHTELINNTKLEPAQLAKILFKESKIPFKEITQGNEEPMIDKQIDAMGEDAFTNEDDKKAYKKYSDDYFKNTTALQQIEVDIKQNPTEKRLEKKAVKVERLASNMRNAYDFLSGIVKAGIKTRQDEFLERVETVRQEIANLRGQAQVNPNDPIAPPQLTPVEPKPLEPPLRPAPPLLPDPPQRPPDEAGMRPPPRQMPSMAQARSELKKYKNKLQPQFTDKVKRAVEVALGKITLQKLEATRPEPKYTFVQRQRDALLQEIRTAGI